MYRYNYYRFIY